MNVFFYGLFMDARLLAEQGVEPSWAKPGFVDGRRLRIGDRATIVPQSDSRVYGVVMDITDREAAILYSEKSVADYAPEPVIVDLMNGEHVEATCYILPADKTAGTNKDYARALLTVAADYGFPEPYLDELRQAQE